MVQGTASGVGKSTIVTGLCRLYARRGFRVAPFKALNVSLNSGPTPDGREIARSQIVQARACGIEPAVEMNPVLLKPQANGRSQIVFLGRPARRVEEAGVVAALETLRSSFERVVLEGAGCAVEPNLKDRANMTIARAAKAPVLLAGDLGPGGVFAALYGTWALLPPRDRRRVRGFIVNRCRKENVDFRALRRRTGVPVVGTVPFLEDLCLPEEDTVRARPKEGPVRIDVVRLPHLSNSTDFEPLEREPDVSLRYVERPAGTPDVLVFPGSKCAAEDLAFVRERGFDALARAAPLVVGICGGMQMLGRAILDPHGVESGRRETPGLGLLEATTTIGRTKRSVRVEGTAMGERIEGYEIRMGRTRIEGRPFADLGGRPDGAITDRVIGTYVHGLFDAPGFRAAFLNAIRRRKGLPECEAVSVPDPFDRLADALEESLDLEFLERLWTA